MICFIIDHIASPNHQVPHALTVEEIAGVVADFKNAAQRCKDAGFDGVEIHDANGCESFTNPRLAHLHLTCGTTPADLLDEFLQSKTNKREDQYGGSLENRTRLLREVIEAILTVFPANRIGVRFSPNGMDSHSLPCRIPPSQPYQHQPRLMLRQATSTTWARPTTARLCSTPPSTSTPRTLATSTSWTGGFLVSGSHQPFASVLTPPPILVQPRLWVPQHWRPDDLPGAARRVQEHHHCQLRCVSAGSTRSASFCCSPRPVCRFTGYTRESGNESLEKKNADLICYGRPYITNPDLPERFAAGAELNDFSSPSHWYAWGEDESPEVGYTDYKTLAEQQKE